MSVLVEAVNGVIVRNADVEGSTIREGLPLLAASASEPDVFARMGNSLPSDFMSPSESMYLT